ncbi:hypothetical protein [Leptodesmis sichuanensis]|uniref:hypothetical protein n=1 Tax=Leptodesmis sichuanensis TaxID=2906798 RepID=UPI001F45AC98|nr:hypothetical protein [Leptodesmis sichuanensis]UIE38394.1 hypothetical protein KIK02_01670 [Leptodesmis sichuanensis A121]
MLAQRRTVLLRRYRKGRPPTTPHSQSPGRFRDNRSLLAMALTNHCLGAFAITANPQTTASTDRVYPTFVTLTLNPSPKAGEGLPIRLPFSLFGRRGWGMRANLHNWDAPD